MSSPPVPAPPPPPPPARDRSDRSGTPADAAPVPSPAGAAGPARPSSSPDAALPPPGWYPDPWWAGSLRWWDGTAWSPEARWANGPTPPPPKEPLRPLAAPAAPLALGLVVAFIVAGRVLEGQVVRFVDTQRALDVLQWGFYVLVYGGIAWTVVHVVRRHGTGSLRDDLGFRFTWSDLGWGPLLFFAARFIQVVVTLPLLAIPVLRHSSERYSELMRDLPDSALVTLVIVGVIVAPLVEELLFRGVLLRGLLSRFGGPVAVVIQGVLFGCYHFAPGLGWYNAVLITANSVLGVVYGFVVLQRRTLGTGIVAHAVTNASAFVIIVATR